MSIPTQAQLGCDVDFYSTRSDGGIGYDGSVNYIICPLSCPEDTTTSNVNGAWECVGLGSISSPSSNQLCGGGLPCGPIPWQMPSLPDIESPTPIIGGGELTITQTPTPTPDVTATHEATATPEPTITPTFDLQIDNIADSIATVSAMSDEIMPEETPFISVDDYTHDIEMIFGYTKSIQSASFGPFAPIMAVVFAALSIYLSMTLFRVLFPLLSALFGLIRRIISLILDFLPF